MTFNPAKAKAIAASLPPHLHQQFGDVLEHLQAVTTTGHVPEGSVAAFLNRQHPEIRNVINKIGLAAETPRDRPFVEKESPAERFESFGIDPRWAVPVADALDGQYVASALQDRMGTDADHASTEPLSTREIIDAAITSHIGDNQK